MDVAVLRLIADVPGIASVPRIASPRSSHCPRNSQCPRNVELVKGLLRPTAPGGNTLVPFGLLQDIYQFDFSFHRAYQESCNEYELRWTME